MAAGLGFKNFSSGEVLTAADVNGYLNSQTVMVFADATARTAAITSPQEGMFSYLKDTNVTQYYTGSAWANLDTTGMVNPMTTTGDTIYSSSGSTPARLGIGSTGQVLTVSGGIPSWATPAGGGQNFSLITSTTMNGSSTVTLSGISGMNELFVTANGWSAAAGNSCFFRLNTDTGSKYYYSGNMATIFSSYTVADFTENRSGAPDAISFYNIGQISNNAASLGSFGIRISGCNSSGIKMLSHVAGATAAGGFNQQLINGQGMYSGTSTISSITVFNGSGVNFDAGTLYVYGSA